MQISYPICYPIPPTKGNWQQSQSLDTKIEGYFLGKKLVANCSPWNESDGHCTQNLRVSLGYLVAKCHQIPLKK